MPRADGNEFVSRLIKGANDMRLTEEEQHKLLEGAQNALKIIEQRNADLEVANKTIKDLSGSLELAAQQIKEKNTLIEQLSKDNLQLVEKLDQLTGKKSA
jgi:methyl-accepting chemotaxis protein